MELEEMLKKVELIRDKRQISTYQVLKEIGICWQTWDNYMSGFSHGSPKGKAKLIAFIRSNLHVLRDDFSLLDGI